MNAEFVFMCENQTKGSTPHSIIFGGRKFLTNHQNFTCNVFCMTENEPLLKTSILS